MSQGGRPDDGIRLSLVVPAYREVATIATTVARVRDELGGAIGGDDLEIVVVDDGSGDGTDDAARAAGADRVVTQPENRGKGAAVRAGVAVAGGRTIAFTDADLSYAPIQVVGLLERVEEGWDMVVGDRHHPRSEAAVRTSTLRSLGSRAVNLVVRLVVRGRYRDTQCGLKAFRAVTARSLFGRSRVDGFAFDVELFALAERDGLRITTAPVEVVNSATTTVHVVQDTVRLLGDVLAIRRRLRRGDYDRAPAPTDPGPGAH